MPIRFDPQCQAAVDLAKKALPEDAELNAETLLAALYHHAQLQSRFPELQRFLRAPVIRRNELPEKVSLARELRPVFQELADRNRPIGAEELFGTLIQSEPGRRLLLANGLTEHDLDRLRTSAQEKPAGWRGSPARLTALQSLSSYGRLLTDTKPLPGQAVECEGTLQALVRTLSKMKRRNAILVGPPGTGKSAIIYELARRIVRGDASLPERIRDLDIFELSPAFLKSGASLIGQYEERVKGLLQVLQANPQVVLFIDEIHSFFQSGVHERGAFTDANESFKGALGRGEIVCIGCTTPGEYRHHIEPDRALERRFGIIRLEAPSQAATLRILQARRARMEAYFAPLKIPEAILSKVIELTEQYLPSRNQPDKSIQLLDEACAWCATATPPAAEVTEPALFQALEDMVGHSLVRSSELTEAGVFAQLQEKIIGQDAVLREIARAFVAGLGGWTRRAGPRGVFLFGGPTGVGKTETALLLAKILGAGRENLIRIDCNTIQNSPHESGPTLNRLLGVPPGYIGYARGQGGLLTRIRDLPECIVLFDEFEKAGPTVGRLLLQIIDNGRIDDVDGNVLDFRRAYIVFTSNAGCRYDHRTLGFSKTDAGPTDMPTVELEALKAELRALGLGEEFLGRITHFLLFQALDTNSIQTILGQQLGRLRDEAKERGLNLEWNDQLVAHLASEWQPRFGVRFATAILRNRIGEQMDIADAQGELKGANRIRIEQLRLDAKAADLPVAGLAVRRREGDTLVIQLG